MAYVLITEHMTQEQVDELDAKLTGEMDRSGRAALVAALGGEVRGA